MDKSFILLFVLLALFSLVIADSNNYKVIRAKIDNKDIISTLNTWDLDVWSHESNLIVGLNDIRANVEDLKAMTELGIEYEVLVEDVQMMLEKMAKEAINETAADWFASYHTFAEFGTYFTNLTTTFPTLMKKSTIGQSIQGNNIDAYVITGTSTATKKKIIFTGMQHAREWISPHTVAYVMTQLVTLYKTDTVVQRMMDSIAFYIVPIVNPDGYLYTWTGSSARLWRKNRRLNSGSTYGVDLNRNWNDHWGGEGSSGTPSSDTYRGTAAFSEPETQAVSKYILSVIPASGYIDFHSYSQIVMRPYGWTKSLPPDSAVQKLVGDNMSAEIKKVHGKTYTSEPANQLYITSGTADDWGYTQAGIKYTYTIELRDTGTYGFQLPANQIIPTGQEIWAAMIYYADYIVKNG